MKQESKLVAISVIFDITKYGKAIKELCEDT
jgi:hypothetical protein